MSEGVIVLEGGTVVTAYGVMEADVWIEDGKIRRVARDTLQVTRGGCRRPITRVDVSGCFLLPGWVSLTRMQGGPSDSTEQYREEIRSLVRQGVTSLVDTVDLDEGMGVEDLWYRLTVHYDSPIDYGARIRIPCRLLKPEVICLLDRHGFRLVEVAAGHPDELDDIPWLALYPFLNKARMALHLHLSDEHGSPRQRKEIAIQWLLHCAYGKVRTCVSGVDPLEWRGEDAFYGIIHVDGDKLGRVLQHMRRHWFGYLPVICPAGRESAEVAAGNWDPVQFLSLLVRIMSTNVAKAIGSYPAKGSLLPGADGDVILLEKGEWLTKFDVSSMLKINELCQPSRVMSKGRWLYDRGVHTFATGRGIRLRDLQPYNYAM